MPLVIGTSPNISIFDFAVKYNLNTQAVTLTNQSTYIGGGAAATQGINFTLTSPSGIVYHENTLWGVNSDIVPASPNTPFTPTEDMVSFLGAIEYGNWVALGTIKDADNTEYELSKTLNICKPKQTSAENNTSNSYADISFVANCNTNVTIYNDNTVYTYKSTAYSAITYSVGLTYPASAALAPIVAANVGYFQKSPVYNGIYQFVISNTATYNFDDSQSVVIVYKLNKDFTISCTIGMCDILCAYAEYIEEYIDTKNNNASSQKARTMQENLLLLNAYIQEAQLGLECGNDISDLVVKIEAIIGKKCDCCGGANNNQGVVTTTNLVIEEGCGDIEIDTVTVGNTTTWTISDTTYVVDTDSEGITVSSNTAGCVKTFTIDSCLDSLTLCNSTLTVANGNGGETYIAQGSDIEDITDAYNTSINVLDTRIDALEVDVAALEAIPTLNNLTLLTTAGTAWATYNSATPQYSKDIWGRVWLQGMATWTGTDPTTTNLIATLPVGYRPTAQRRFKALVGLTGGSSATQSQFDVTIETTGSILLSSNNDSVATGADCFVSFDSINFIAA